MVAATHCHTAVLGPGRSCEWSGCEAPARESLTTTYSNGWKECDFFCPTHTDERIAWHKGCRR